MSNKTITSKLDEIKFAIANLEHRISHLRDSKNNPFFQIGIASNDGSYVRNVVELDNDINEKIKLLIIDFVSEQLERCELAYKNMTDPLQIAIKLTAEI